MRMAVVLRTAATILHAQDVEDRRLGNMMNVPLTIAYRAPRSVRAMA